jgi:capsular exopolysaccharide synthesis family protein
MAGRMIPVIKDACKTLGFDFSTKESANKMTSENKTNQSSTSQQQPNKDNDKEKGWLKTQATVADVYQQRLDRALFGGIKQGDKSSTANTDSTNQGVQASGQTVSQRGQEILLKSRSSVAEAYRTIRTAVFFGIPKDEAKTILVTSPAPGDGKSTLASNLAIAMAQAGQKTLILDCDFRKPRQQDIFEHDNKEGFTNIFAENIPIEKVIERGPVNGLDILTRGPEVPNPCEMLNSTAFVDILKKLSEKYDRIIIDSAPVTAVADSQILSAIADVTILVLRAEKSTRRLSQQAMHLLLSVGARVLGVVVNGVPVGGGHYGYYSGYGYYGKYGRYGYGQNAREVNLQPEVKSEIFNKKEVKV